MSYDGVVRPVRQHSENFDPQPYCTTTLKAATFASGGAQRNTHSLDANFQFEGFRSATGSRRKRFDYFQTNYLEAEGLPG